MCGFSLSISMCVWMYTSTTGLSWVWTHITRVHHNRLSYKHTLAFILYYTEDLQMTWWCCLLGVILFKSGAWHKSHIQNNNCTNAEQLMQGASVCLCSYTFGVFHWKKQAFLKEFQTDYFPRTTKSCCVSCFQWTLFITIYRRHQDDRAMCTAIPNFWFLPTCTLFHNHWKIKIKIKPSWRLKILQSVSIVDYHNTKRYMLSLFPNLFEAAAFQNVHKGWLFLAKWT